MSLKFFLSAAGVIVANLLFSQTYTSSSALDVYLPCPTDGPVVNSCGTFEGDSFGTGIKVAGIYGNQITFTITNCTAGSFNSDGVFEVRGDSICGALIDSISYLAGEPDASLTVTADFVSGSRDYVGVAVSDDGSSYHSRTITITAVPPTITCDTFSNVLGSDAATLFPADTGGFVSGHNNYGDVSKADSFYASGTDSITAVLLIFAVAEFGDTNSTVSINIWDGDGTGSAPGALLASEDITIKSIAEQLLVVNNINTYPVYMELNPPAAVSGTYYAGIGELTYAPGDTVALFTTPDLTGRTGTAWEEWNTGEWYNYRETWGGEIAHFVFPISCSEAPASVRVIHGDKNIVVKAAPNPFSGYTIITAQGVNGKFDFSLYDVAGKLQKKMNSIETNSFVLMREGLAAGIYFFTIAGKGARATGKLIIE